MSFTTYQDDCDRNIQFKQRPRNTTRMDYEVQKIASNEWCPEASKISSLFPKSRADNMSAKASCERMKNWQ